MKFKVLVKAFSTFGWLTNLFGGDGYTPSTDCTDILNILHDTETNRYCEEDQNGKVIGISLDSLYDIGQESINQIMQYDTIEKLYIDGFNSQYSTGIPINIGDLKNLKTLVINDIKSFNMNDTFNLPPSIETLSLINIQHLTQDDINGLENLTNLKKLTITDYSIGEELDFKPVENLENLKQLDIFNSYYDDDKYSTFKYLEHFKNLEELTIEKSDFSRDDLDIIMKSLPNLKKLSNRSVYRGSIY